MLHIGTEPTRDVVIIGSGFGGAPVALRLAEKGYDTLILERGRRFRDEDFPQTNWQVSKYLWLPALRLYGMLHIDFFRHVVALHGSGVGGGSLIYGNVLVEPNDAMYAAAGWPAHWQESLRPHLATVKRMLGVTVNPKEWPADIALQAVAREFGREETYSLTSVGTFFGEPGKTVPDPYFGGAGPARTGCTHCGGCMIGCRTGGKNTLVKNYLYLAERLGTEIRAETEVRDIRPLPAGQSDGARYAVLCRSVVGWRRKTSVVRARRVVVSASTLGTLRLLLRCRDVTHSLSALSPTLGSTVRTNGEALLGSTARTLEHDYSEGIAITSYFHPDDVTTVEPVRFPAGSSLMKFLSSPAITGGGTVATRLLRILGRIMAHPVDFAKTHVLPGWAKRTTILLVMQTMENSIRVRLGRSILTLWRNDLVSEPNPGHSVVGRLGIAHRVRDIFAVVTNGIRGEAWNESLINTPTTAHILGGVPFGADATDGVIGSDFQVHGYSGLYVCDGSVIRANPGFNPSLTIAAHAELCASQFPVRPPMG